MQIFLATLTFGWLRKLLIFQASVVPPIIFLTGIYH